MKNCRCNIVHILSKVNYESYEHVQEPITLACEFQNLSLLKRDEVQNLSCKIEFYWHEKKNHFHTNLASL